MAATSVAQVLMRKGKRGAATYVNSECNRTSDPQHLYELLDLLLNPSKPIDDSETVDWIKWLISGGKTPVEFATTIRRYDNGTTCGLVWTANFVAYRCRTCGISPCMSLCAECFQKGDHQGHDFNMFRSQAGGACDCGDTSVMKESGFCDRHGPQAQVNKPTAPKDLLCVAEAVMPRIFLRVIQHLRENSLPDELEKHLQCISETEPFLNLLHEYSSLGAALRRVMTSSLINPTVYEELTEVASGETEYAQKMKEQQRAYEEALRTLPGPDPVEEYKDLPPLKNSLVHRTFLEELVFWTVKFEFPQKLVCLLLNMLPDPDYKEAFTRAFVLHYARISRLLVKSSDADTLSNRVVHVSVQLFSNEDLAFRMVDSLSLLHVLVVSLKDMMSRILIPSTLQDAEKNFHFVVDCSEHVMKDHCYWPLVSDLSNVLSHKPVALRFLSDDGLLEMWFSFLAMFQGMNVNQREMNSHVEFEPNTYYAAFSAELEAPASTMWALLFHLKDAETSQLTLNLIRHCITALQDWFDAINFTHPDMSDPYQVSFHLPLHRYLATFTCQAVRNQGIPLKQLLPPPEMLHLIMMHPLRIQVSFYEILCGLWVRNGLQIKGQAMTYIQCHFGNSMVDADLYLLQLCATHLPAPTFWMTVLERFHVLATLSVNPQGTNTFLDAEHEMPMLESWLTFMASILNIRTNIGLSERDLERLEMVSLLCMSDRTHSQLMELLPEKCGAPQNKDFDAVLAQVADYRAPNVEASGSLQQGHYVPKPEVWEQLYDPIYVLLRAVHRRDFQASMDRFTQFIQQTGRWKTTEGSSNTLWPPFRLPGPVHPTYPDPRIILQSGTAHAVIWSLLYKALYSPANQLPEQVLALTVYLLDMAVSFQIVPTQPSGQEICVRDNRIRHCEKERLDVTFQDWFDSDYVAENVCIPITRVKLIPQTAVSLNSTDGGEIDVDSSDGEMDVSDLPSEMIDAHNYLPLENSPLDSPVQYRALTAGNEVVVSNVPNFHVPTITSPLSPPSPFRNPPLSPARNSPIVTQTGPLVLSPRIDAPPPRRGSGVGEPGPSGFQGPRSMSLNGSQGMLVVPRPSIATEGIEGPSGCLPLVRSDSISSPLEGDSGYALPPPSSEYVETRESIISLLLKLHSKMTGTADSYEPATTPVPGAAESSHKNSASSESRVGDGPFFVRKVLDKLCAMDARVRDCVLRTRQELWPRTVEEQAERKKHKDSKEREEKRMKAKERQQKLMAEFASRQKQFMKQAMQESETAESMEDSESAEPDAAETAAAPTQELYDCVICNQTTPSSIDRPVCLVVLIQATSVVGHRRLGAPVALPMTEVGRPGTESLGADWERRMEILSRNFEETSWLRSVNSGFQGGVHLQTCGHYLHLDCQKAYLASLRTQQRQQSLAVERGEFACPLCRQLANSVLPVAPEMGHGMMVSSQNKNLTSVSEELQLLLLEEPPIPVSSVLIEAMGSVMEHMTSSTFPRYRQVTPSPSAASMLLFVCSIARTNLEIEILQRDDQLTSAYPSHDTAPGTSTGNSPLPGLSSLLPKRSCLVPLLHVLAMHSKLLTSRCNGEDSSMKYYSELWNHVTGLTSRGEAAKADSLAVQKKDVPLLLSDASALLLQFSLVLPLQVDKAFVLCLVQGLYNVAYFQQLCQLCLQMGERGRALWRSRALPERAGSPTPGTFCGWDLPLMLGLVLSLLEHSPLFLDEEDEDGVEDEDWSELRVEEELQKMLLPFMRISALLVHHLYKLPLPVRESAALRGEFAALSQYLGLVNTGSSNSTGTSSTSANTGTRTDTKAWHGLRWAQGVEAVSLIRTWCEEVCEVAGRAGGVARGLMVSYRPWNRPRLLGLPENYDVVFQYYHHRPCANCTEVPKEPSLCLVCGKLVCLRENCCRRQNMHEAVQHSVDCGAGTAIFLAVNSCTIIVIRGKRACLWGSVYLDAFGEEDRDLKRGKPLFLSKDRYQLLEMQWLAHRFDHTNKKWIWHRDVL